MAASVTTETSYTGSRICKLIFDIVFNTGDGTFTDHTVTTKFEGELIAIETNPGGTAPTDQYDITLEDAEGLDILQGVGANRATATTEMAAIVFGTYFHPVIDASDTLTLKIANQSVNSALTKIIIYYSK